MENRTDQDAPRRDPPAGQQACPPHPQRADSSQRLGSFGQQPAVAAQPAGTATAQKQPGFGSSTPQPTFGTSAQPASQSAGQRMQREAEATKQQAAGAAQTAKAQAAEVGRAVSEEATQAADDARRAAVQAGERLKSEGRAIFSRQRAAAAEELTHLRDALHAASEQLHDEEDHRIADFTEVAADRLDAVAQYIRGQDLGRLASDVAQAARRRPAVFYGGLFAVGLAASRFLKSSSHRSSSDRTPVAGGFSNDGRLDT